MASERPERSWNIDACELLVLKPIADKKEAGISYSDLGSALNNLLVGAKEGSVSYLGNNWKELTDKICMLDLARKDKESSLFKITKRGMDYISAEKNIELVKSITGIDLSEVS